MEAVVLVGTSRGGSAIPKVVEGLSKDVSITQNGGASVGVTYGAHDSNFRSGLENREFVICLVRGVVLMSRGRFREGS